MNMGNVIGDPFALASISIAMLAWVIAFISSIVAAVQTNDLPNLAWWILALEVGIVGAVFFVVASDTIQTYHVALTAYQTLALATLSILLNRIVYDGRGAMQAASAGYVLLSVVMALWMIYFGSAPSASPRAYVDSFALQKEGHGSRNTMTYGTGRPETSTSVQPPQMYTSAQLNGFENPSPVGGISQSQAPRNSAVPNLNSTGVTANGKPPGQDQEVGPPTEYPYRAKAIYSYEANPEDANEISFSKHEILEVSDVSGRWWQARKESGDTGIAPSNYLILL